MVSHNNHYYPGVVHVSCCVTCTPGRAGRELDISWVHIAVIVIVVLYKYPVDGLARPGVGRELCNALGSQSCHSQQHTKYNKHVIITSNWRFAVIITCLLHFVPFWRNNYAFITFCVCRVGILVLYIMPHVIEIKYNLPSQTLYNLKLNTQCARNPHHMASRRNFGQCLWTYISDLIMMIGFKSNHSITELDIWPLSKNELMQWISAL